MKAKTGFGLSKKQNQLLRDNVRTNLPFPGHGGHLKHRTLTSQLLRGRLKSIVKVNLREKTDNDSKRSTSPSYEQLCPGNLPPWVRIATQRSEERSVPIRVQT